MDDEPDAREIIRRLLISRGARPLVAASAEEARLAIAREQPQVIVSDIGMPGTDGYQFMRQIRREGVGIPAMALTAFARAEDRARSLQAGFQMHIAKPVEPAELLAAVGSLAGRLAG